MTPLSVSDLARDPARVHEASPGDAARLLSELAGLSLALAAQLSTAASDSRTDKTERWLTADECAALAGVSRRQVYSWSRRTDWRAFARRLSRKALRIEVRGFLRWLNRQPAK
jgi:hypothetical protein